MLVGAMVSFNLIKGFVAFAPLVSVVCGTQCSNGTVLPSLAEATTEELAAGLMARQFTSVDLVHVCIAIHLLQSILTMLQAYIARIMEANVTLNVVTEVNPDAVAIAKELDCERASGKLRG